MRWLVVALVLAVGCADEGPGMGMPDAGVARSACTTDDDCAEGVCEGIGCGTPEGVCRVSYGGCLRDSIDYCGCDGETFRASSTCPADRYEHVGACE